MVNNVPKPPTPINEPVLGYLPNSPERAALKAELKRQARCNQAGVVEGQDTGADIARQEQGAELGAGQSLPLKSYTKKKPQPFFTIDKDYN